MASETSELLKHQTLVFFVNKIVRLIVLKSDRAKIKSPLNSARFPYVDIRLSDHFLKSQFRDFNARKPAIPLAHRTKTFRLTVEK